MLILIQILLRILVLVPIHVIINHLIIMRIERRGRGWRETHLHASNGG